MQQAAQAAEVSVAMQRDSQDGGASSASEWEECRRHCWACLPCASCCPGCVDEHEPIDDDAEIPDGNEDDVDVDDEDEEKLSPARRLQAARARFWNTRVLPLWERWLIVVSLYYLLALPLRLALYDPSTPDTSSSLAATSSWVWLLLDYAVFDPTLVVDSWLRWRCFGVFDPKSGLFHNDRAHVRRYYLRWGVAGVDVVSLLPTDLLALIPALGAPALPWLRLIRLMRTVRSTKNN